LIQNATTGKNQPAYTEKISQPPAMIGDDPVQLFSNFSLTATRRGSSFYYELDADNIRRFLRELEHYLL
jgi:hypothetical protein